MQNFESAEKILTKANKKHPQNNEVRSVFTWVLLQQQKFDDACEVSEKLKDTAYAGLYAESRFKQYSLLEQDFLQENFQIEYLYAYNATDSVKFLQNASIYECFNGNYEKAFSYHPIKMTKY